MKFKLAYLLGYPWFGAVEDDLGGFGPADNLIWWGDHTGNTTHFGDHTGLLHLWGSA